MFAENETLSTGKEDPSRVSRHRFLQGIASMGLAACFGAFKRAAGETIARPPPILAGSVFQFLLIESPLGTLFPAFLGWLAVWTHSCIADSDGVGVTSIGLPRSSH